MSDLNSITKRLRYGQARIATVQEAMQAQLTTGSTNPDKYVTIDSSRAIGLVPVNLVIPRYTFSYSFHDGIPLSRLLFQYTVNMPSRFYFTKPLVLDISRAPWYGFLAVRYRVGNVAHRYMIRGFSLTGSLQRSTIAHYNGEVIEANCCIEFWSYNKYANPIFTPSPYNAGMPYDVTLETSLLRTPETNDQLSQSIVLAQLVSFNDLALTAFPWSDPVVNTKCAFVTN